MKAWVSKSSPGRDFERLDQGIVLDSGSSLFSPTHLRVRELITHGEGCSSSPPQHCQILHWTPTCLQQGRVMVRIPLKSSGYSVLLGRGEHIKHPFTCKGRSAKPHFLMCASCAQGHRAPALSSSLAGKWGHRVREGLRPWVVQNTVQHCSCAGSCG